MGVENQQQNNNEEFKSNDILYVVSKEIHELTDAKKDNNNIDFKQLNDEINKNFENELQKALENKPLILNQLLTTCKGYIENNPNHGDSELKNLYKILENINNSRTSSESETESVSETKDITLSKEQAEIKDNINVTLRGTRSEKSWKKDNGITSTELTNNEKQNYNKFLETEKQKIKEKLNSYVNKRNTLNDNQKTVLILTKHALESTSHDDGQGNPVSGEVLVLERKLNELGYMPKEANNGNNGVDGKFGTKTYEAIINCMEGKLTNTTKEQAEIQQDNIKVTLRGKWSKESWMKQNGKESQPTQEDNDKYEKFLAEEKDKITTKLNEYKEKWNDLNDDQKTVLIWAKYALESTSHDDGHGNPVSDEVLRLERKLNELGYMPEIPDDGNNGIDGKFGTKTYQAIINCMEGKLTNTTKEQAEIQQDNIKVTLRGEWSKDKWMEKNNIKEGNNNTTNEENYEKFLAEEKDKITTKLNEYKEKWNDLNDDQKTVLIWAKYALESTSHDDGHGNPVSDEVLRLERKLNELGYMPEIPDDGNNGIDGKFGTKTYQAIINCMEGKLTNTTKEQAEIKTDKEKTFEQFSNLIPDNLGDLSRLEKYIENIKEYINIKDNSEKVLDLFYKMRKNNSNINNSKDSNNKKITERDKKNYWEIYNHISKTYNKEIAKNDINFVFKDINESNLNNLLNSSTWNGERLQDDKYDNNIKEKCKNVHIQNEFIKQFKEKFNEINEKRINQNEKTLSDYDITQILSLEELAKFSIEEISVKENENNVTKKQLKYGDIILNENRNNFVEKIGSDEKAQKLLELNGTNFINEEELINLVKNSEEIKKSWYNKICDKKSNNNESDKEGETKETNPENLTELNGEDIKESAIFSKKYLKKTIICENFNKALNTENITDNQKKILALTKEGLTNDWENREDNKSYKAIAELQGLLNVKADGKFGIKTFNALLQKFGMEQSSNPTGIGRVEWREENNRIIGQYDTLKI